MNHADKACNAIDMEMILQAHLKSLGYEAGYPPESGDLERAEIRATRNAWTVALHYRDEMLSAWRDAAQKL